MKRIPFFIGLISLFIYSLMACVNPTPPAAPATQAQQTAVPSEPPIGPTEAPSTTAPTGTPSPPRLTVAELGALDTALQNSSGVNTQNAVPFADLTSLVVVIAPMNTPPALDEGVVIGVIKNTADLPISGSQVLKTGIWAIIWTKTGMDSKQCKSECVTFANDQGSSGVLVEAKQWQIQKEVPPLIRAKPIIRLSDICEPAEGVWACFEPSMDAYLTSTAQKAAIVQQMTEALTTINLSPDSINIQGTITDAVNLDKAAMLVAPAVKKPAFTETDPCSNDADLLGVISVLEPLGGEPDHPPIPKGAYAVRGAKNGDEAKGCYIPGTGEPIPVPADFVGELLDEDTNPQALIIGYKIFLCFLKECR